MAVDMNYSLNDDLDSLQKHIEILANVNKNVFGFISSYFKLVNEMSDISAQDEKLVALLSRKKRIDSV